MEYHNEISDSKEHIMTDFEYLELNMIDREKFVKKEINLIRFLNDEFFEDEIELHGVFFLPSHIEKKIINKISDEEKLDEYLKSYCNDYLLELTGEELSCEEIIYDIIDNNIVKHSNRSNVSTSFFKIFDLKDDDISIIKEVVKELKENIKTLRDYRVSVGSIVEEDLGILEVNGRPRTKDPESRHCNFWKYNQSRYNKTFNDLSNNFKLIKV